MSRDNAERRSECDEGKPPSAVLGVERAPRTLAILKPDIMSQGREIDVMLWASFEGFRVVALKRGVADRATWERFYAEHRGRPFFDALVDFMASGPVLVVAFERRSSITAAYVVWRNMLGATDARSAGPRTLRGMWGDKTGTAIWRNCAHGSDSEASVERDMVDRIRSRVGY